MKLLESNLTDKDIPEWLRFPYLTTGYREGGSYKSCFKSIFALHNESVNAWLMILASIFSISALIYIMFKNNLTYVQQIPFYLLTASALIHLPFSVGYHLFLPISPLIYNKWRRLDISFIFISSCLLTPALCFFVMPYWATFLVTSIAVIVTIIAILRISRFKAGESLQRKQYILFIGIIVCIYYFPIAFKAVKDILHRKFTVAIASAIIIPVVLLLGSFVYSKAWPESAYPVTFDLFGSSHQIAHIAILVAHIMEFFFIYSQI